MSNEYAKMTELEQAISELPQGSITYKKINGKKQPYLQWTENGKSKSKYIKVTARRLSTDRHSICPMKATLRKPNVVLVK